MKLSEKFKEQTGLAICSVSNAEFDSVGEPLYDYAQMELCFSHALDNITPKIAIDFAEWIYKNAEMSVKADSGWVMGQNRVYIRRFIHRVSKNLQPMTHLLCISNKPNRIGTFEQLIRYLDMFHPAYSQAIITPTNEVDRTMPYYYVNEPDNTTGTTLFMFKSNAELYSNGMAVIELPIYNQQLSIL